MTDVFVAADNILSPLGSTTRENFGAVKAGITGVRRHYRPEIAEQEFYASLMEPDAGYSADGGRSAGGGRSGDGGHRLSGEHRYTKFEQLLIASIADALQASGIQAKDKRTMLIVCSTKGNIHMLDDGPQITRDQLSLPGSAAALARHFGFVHTPLVISNACISGLLGLITGMRLIRAGVYENVVVAGADVITKFILSGFNSFQALSPGYCRPFDRDRDGINLGEGAATVALSSRPQYKQGIRVRGGAVSNDANHISGPSRTGKELSQAIDAALRDAGSSAAGIGFISAHGTATPYNDEMEAKAITLAGLQHVPVNSLKGYYGHTLGAAGLIETIITLQSMREGVVIPSRGFENNGVTTPLNVCSSLLYTPLNTCLKTASGFGGCNAAIVLGK